jgi:hypothetical protein
VYTTRGAHFQGASTDSTFSADAPGVLLIVRFEDAYAGESVTAEDCPQHWRSVTAHTNEPAVVRVCGTGGRGVR